MANQLSNNGEGQGRPSCPECGPYRPLRQIGSGAHGQVWLADGPEGRVARRIAITSSMTGYHGMPQCPAYSASKACVKALGAALRGRVRGEGIAVTTICPGFVRSRITDRNTCPMPFFMEADRAARIILARTDRNTGLIAFPWPMRLATWLLASLPFRVNEWINRLLPDKIAPRRD